MEYESADLVGEIFAEFGVADEEAHVDGSVERVEDEIEIAVERKLAAIDAALQCFVGAFAAGPEEALAEGFDELGIGLTSGE